MGRSARHPKGLRPVPHPKSVPPRPLSTPPGTGATVASVKDSGHASGDHAPRLGPDDSDDSRPPRPGLHRLGPREDGLMLEFVERAAASRDLQELWDYHCRRMADFGFDRLLYGLTHYRTATGLGDPQDLLVLTNHPRDYIDTFLNEGLYHHAPMVRWSLENVGTCSWRWMQEQAEAGLMTPSERRVYDFNRRHGIRAGYSISFGALTARTRAGIGLIARSGMSHDDVESVWAEHGRTIEAMNHVAHLRYVSLPHAGARRPLTPRQREVLEWVGDGKTVADIAEIMGLTTATVEKHLRLARAALDVETTAQAVLKASFHNQIHVVEV